MNFIRVKDNNKGFTALEMILSIGIGAAVATSAAMVVFYSFQWRKDALSDEVVLGNTAEIGDTLENEITSKIPSSDTTNTLATECTSTKCTNLEIRRTNPTSGTIERIRYETQCVSKNLDYSGSLPPSWPCTNNEAPVVRKTSWPDETLSNTNTVTLYPPNSIAGISNEDYLGMTFSVTPKILPPNVRPSWKQQNPAFIDTVKIELTAYRKKANDSVSEIRNVRTIATNPRVSRDSQLLSRPTENGRKTILGHGTDPGASVNTQLTRSIDKSNDWVTRNKEGFLENNNVTGTEDPIDRDTASEYPNDYNYQTPGSYPNTSGSYPGTGNSNSSNSGPSGTSGEGSGGWSNESGSGDPHSPPSGIGNQN